MGRQLNPDAFFAQKNKTRQKINKRLNGKCRLRRAQRKWAANKALITVQTMKTDVRGETQARLLFNLFDLFFFFTGFVSQRRIVCKVCQSGCCHSFNRATLRPRTPPSRPPPPPHPSHVMSLRCNLTEEGNQMLIQCPFFFFLFFSFYISFLSPPSAYLNNIYPCA